MPIQFFVIYKKNIWTKYATIPDTSKPEPLGKSLKCNNIDYT